MRRNATLSLEGFDPEVIEAAREVAQRAGVPLETWIESVVDPDKAPTRQPPSRSTASASPHGREPDGARSADIDAGSVRESAADRELADVPRFDLAGHDSRHAEPDPAPAARIETVTPTPPPSDLPAEPVGASIAEMMRRLDALDRSLSEDRHALREAEARAAEARKTGLAESGPQVYRVSERLSEIEKRMGDLDEQFAGPRALGRRGRPVVAEMREAIEDVRRRQRELDAAGPVMDASPAASRRGVRRLSSEANLPAPAITELQAETSRLRDSLGSLATGRDVGALEQAMRALAADVQRVREPAALAEPIAAMRRQVEHLAEEVADNVHARLVGEVERLASRADGSLGVASASHADRSALDAVHRELDEIRHLIAGLAGPERIHSLAQGLQAISGQIAQLQNGARNQEVAELRPLLEEIRSGLAAPGDARHLLGRIEALADRIDEVGVNPVRDLIGRLEKLDANSQQPAASEGDLASMNALLRGLAEKVDRIGSGAGNLDALESQILALARRLETRAADPSLAGLERTMDELLTQIVALRDESSVEAVVERAARRAVAEAIGPGGASPPSAQVDTLRADLDELRARQISADQRMHATMDSLNAVLARLVDRLGMPETGAAGIRAPRREEGAALSEQLLASTALGVPRPEPIPVAAPRGRAGPRQEPGPGAVADATGLGDELLEPGASRPAHAPGRTRASLAEPAPAALGGDIKTNFIAAARRAAQAAQADIAADAPAAPERRESGRPRLRNKAAAATASGIVGRLFETVEKRRRPLLLGLASVVLVLGAFQAFQMSVGSPEGEHSSTPTVAANPAPAASEAPGAQASSAQASSAQASSAQASSAQASSAQASSAQASSAQASSAQASSALAAPEASVASTPSVEPQTTQSITDPGAGAKPAATAGVPPKTEDSATRLAAAASQPAFPQIASMATLGRDLSTVPAGLASLKQSALDGDGAAIYELAGREADGRGMPRDLVLAAKLYEKLASAGYAPAQFKLGSFHEKGSGVIRDVGQAKSWYGKAAERGNIRAMHNLAVLHAENPGATGKPDFATAASWFRRAAEYGVRDSQYNLAVLYARGLGVGQDLVQSHFWFSAAAAQGDDEAGKKRDDVAAKLSPKDLATAKALAAAFKAKPGDPSANDPPPARPVAPPAAMSLLGAPPPGSPPATSFVPAGPRSPSGPGSTGV